MAFQGALKVASAIECLHYALNLPTSVVVTGCETLERVEQAVTAARTFRPLKEAAVAELLARPVIGGIRPGRTVQALLRFRQQIPGASAAYEA